ncbi:hypothetical protein [Salegentibacter mishustinae]|uniref:hypothetical protein n=1 Tax=Salegentibacter mishustinae TaxID=270918 RepID=UPI002490DFDD|nr:hypothetical protein [Salegentibacter mishustinae]
MKNIFLILILFTSKITSQNTRIDAKLDTIFEWSIKNERDSILHSKKIIYPDNTFKQIFYSSQGEEEYMQIINRITKVTLPIPGWEDKSVWLKGDNYVSQRFYDYDEYGYPENLTVIHNGESTREKIRKTYKETRKGWQPITIEYSSEKYLFEYDDNDNLSQIVKYDNKGNIKRIFTYQNNKIKEIANQHKIIEEYIYDNQGQSIRKEDRAFIYKYSYNKLGKVSRIEKLVKSSKMKIELTELDYFENGNLKSEKSYKFSKMGQEKKLQEHTIYTNN